MPWARSPKFRGAICQALRMPPAPRASRWPVARASVGAPGGPAKLTEWLAARAGSARPGALPRRTCWPRRSGGSLPGWPHPGKRAPRPDAPESQARCAALGALQRRARSTGCATEGRELPAPSLSARRSDSGSGSARSRLQVLNFNAPFASFLLAVEWDWICIVNRSCPTEVPTAE
jgi:hypothetical protein